MNEDQDVVERELEARNEAIKKLAEKQSAKYLNKHKAEIKRLRLHAEDSLHTNNKEAYIYAIQKLRSLTMQKPVDRQILEGLWTSSKERYDQLVQEAYKYVSDHREMMAINSNEEQLTAVCSI